MGSATAESNRALYKAFLKRAKELSEQEEVNTSNVRLIAPALPPAARSSPKLSLVLAGLLFAGLALGAGLALVRDLFARSPQRRGLSGSLGHAQARPSMSRRFCT